MAQFASDAFGGTEGTELSTYSASWAKITSLTGNAEISSGRLRQSSTTAAGYYHSGTPAGADYTVNADLHVPSGGSNSGTACITGRTSTSAYTCYRARWTTAFGLQLHKLVSGTATQLGSNVSASLAANTTNNLKLEVIGSAINLYWGGSGTASISSTDSSITAAGKAGVIFFADSAPSDTAGVHLDNFSADDVSSGVTGTISATWENFTSSITGTTTVVGTISQTLSNFTSSISGSPVNSGTINQTLEDHISNMSGSVGSTVSGTIAVTLENFTQSAQGTTTVVGNIAVNLSNFVSSITGTTTVVGTSNITLEPFIMTANGYPGDAALIRIRTLVGAGE